MTTTTPSLNLPFGIDSTCRDLLRLAMSKGLSVEDARLVAELRTLPRMIAVLRKLTVPGGLTVAEIRAVVRGE